MEKNFNTKTKRIAKNTLVLYARMLFMMVISLYTSRVILNALGVEDYGIYSVVGGFVTMFTILSGSLSAAISRFITYELGTGNKERLNLIFSSSVTIQVAMAVVVALVSEIIGLWFLNYKMVIPEGRLVAANWCFQFSVISFVLKLISVPYNATIVAYEKMSAFAYISILEAIGKLIISWLIVYNPFDRLIFFAAMIALLSWTIRAIYATYCKRHFEECHFHLVYDKVLLKKMFSFASWNFLGSSSHHLMREGVNLLSNVYFGVTVNAARGIANQVDHAVMRFVGNFTKALNPQITKSYAANEKDYMFSLMFRGAKFSYFLVLLFAVPLICEAPMILRLWLKVVPEHTVNFSRLAIVISLIQVLSNTMVTAMLATGDIKKYQIIVGGLGLLVFPLSWFLFFMGFPPESSYLCIILVFIAQWVCRLVMLRGMIGLSIAAYMRAVMSKAFITTLLSFPIPVLLCSLMNESIIRFVIVIPMSMLITSFVILYIGMSSKERTFLLSHLPIYKHSKHHIK